MRDVLRLFCAFVDAIIVAIIYYLILHVIARHPVELSFVTVVVFAFIFAVYNGAMLCAMKGSSPGKRIGKFIVLEWITDPEKLREISVHTAIVREGLKAFYCVPILGWAALAFSIYRMFDVGETLHDFITKTAVTLLDDIKD